MEQRWSYFESQPFGVSSVEKCGARLISKILNFDLWNLYTQIFSFMLSVALIFHKQISPLSSLKNWVIDHDIVNSACVLSHFSCLWLFVTLWTIVCQVPLSMGFFRQENWSGLPCPSPGDLPDPGIKPTSLKSPSLAGEFFTTSATWEARSKLTHLLDSTLSSSIYHL